MPRISALILSMCLALPDSVLALRQVNVGDNVGLEEKLGKALGHSGSGLEEGEADRRVGQRYRPILTALHQHFGIDGLRGKIGIELGPTRDTLELFDHLRSLGVQMTGVGDEAPQQPGEPFVQGDVFTSLNDLGRPVDFIYGRQVMTYAARADRQSREDLLAMYRAIAKALKSGGLFVALDDPRELGATLAPTDEELRRLGFAILADEWRTLSGKETDDLELAAHRVLVLSKGAGLEGQVAFEADLDSAVSVPSGYRAGGGLEEGRGTELENTVEKNIARVAGVLKQELEGNPLFVVNTGDLGKPSVKAFVDLADRFKNEVAALNPSLIVVGEGATFYKNRPSVLMCGESPEEIAVSFWRYEFWNWDAGKLHSIAVGEKAHEESRRLADALRRSGHAIEVVTLSEDSLALFLRQFLEVLSGTDLSSEDQVKSLYGVGLEELAGHLKELYGLGT